MAISKSELLRRTKEIIVSEGYAIPLYMGHILQTTPWYGLNPDHETLMRDVLTLIKSESEAQRGTLEEIYQGILQRNQESF